VDPDSSHSKELVRLRIAQHAPRRLTVGQNLALSFFWFTSNVQWTALIIVVMPAVIRSFVGSTQSGTVLSLISAAGALIATVAQPIVGALSDRALHPWGRRRPYMLWGVLASAVLLVLMGFAPSIWLFSLYYFLLQVFSNVAGAPYAALIPDVVVAEQRGTASGYMGLMNQAAVIAGVIIPARFSVPVTFEVLAALQLAGLVVTLLGVPEVPLTRRDPFDWRAFAKSFWIPPRLYSDWWWVFITRFLVLLGFGTLEYYIYYYLAYVQHLPNPSGEMEPIFLLLTVGSLISVLTAGWLSDRLGRRKPMVTIGGLLMGLVAMGFVFTHSVSLILALAFVFGVGYGMYLSTDWALAVDVLPPTDNAAKDMGLWSISQTLSQTVATLVGGLLLAVFTVRLGLVNAYRALYLLTFVYFLLGSVLIVRVRGAR
jgi:MFS family permease